MMSVQARDVTGIAAAMGAIAPQKRQANKKKGKSTEKKACYLERQQQLLKLKGQALMHLTYTFKDKQGRQQPLVRVVRADGKTELFNVMEAGILDHRTNMFVRGSVQLRCEHPDCVHLDSIRSAVVSNGENLKLSQYDSHFKVRTGVG